MTTWGRAAKPLFTPKQTGVLLMLTAIAMQDLRGGLEMFGLGLIDFFIILLTGVGLATCWYLYQLAKKHEQQQRRDMRRAAEQHKKKEE